MSQLLAKGANAPLPDTALQVDVTASTPLDVAAILVTARGKVRSDDDFVFFNQPVGPGVRLLGSSRLGVTLDAVPPDVDRVVVTASLDLAVGPPNFGAVRDIGVLVRTVPADGGQGVDLVRFEPSGLHVETAVLLVELYRRHGSWKVRAIGQGYASGLAGLATDFGIDVTDPGPTAPASPAAPRPATPAPPSWDEQTQVVQPPTTAPPPSVARPPAAPQPPAARFGPSSRANLDRGRVTLRTGETVTLVKTGGPPPNRVRVGMGWDVVDSAENTYLDASCILYDAAGKDVDKVWFMSKKAVRGAVRHGGDSSRRRDGGEEFVHVDLAAIPPHVRTLVFTVNSFGGQRFAGIRSVSCRLVDDHTGVELVRFDVADTQPQTGLVLCKVQRDLAVPQVWAMTAIGVFHDGKTVRAMVGPAKQYL